MARTRTCVTCAKLASNGKCRVLLELVGLDGDCWAWTDDPAWEAKVEVAVKEYALTKGVSRRATAG